MRLHFSFLFLITFLSFLSFTRAGSRVTQAAEIQLEIPIECDSEWKGFGSLFRLTNIADKIREASFIPNLLHGILLASNPGKVQPEAQVSPGGAPENRSEPPQGGLEALFEETSKIIRSFVTTADSIVALGTGFQDVLESVSPNGVPSCIAPFTPLLKKVEELVATTCDDFRGRFPLPATAPGHTERVISVSEAVEYLQRLVIRVARSYEIEQEVVEHHLARAKPFFHDMGVFIGDVAELHPAAMEALVLHLSAVLFPEAVLLRSLVILYCFGPYVLGKDAISGWLLEHVSDIFRV